VGSVHRCSKRRDRRWLGYNYDIGHATVEGGFRRLAVKHASGGAHDERRGAEGFPLGSRAGPATGARSGVRWAPGWSTSLSFSPCLKETRFNGPLQIHYEFPLGGRRHGQRKISIDKPALFAALRKDLVYTRELLKQSGLA